MDLIKIGKFIANCRKDKKITQEKLAEKLYISDRAISKWERGLSLPDTDKMLELCDILDITVNELLNGEKTEMNDDNKKTEKLLIDMVKQKKESDKRLLSIEIVIGILITVILLALVFIASFCEMEYWLRITLILTGFIPLVIIVPFAIMIEQKAGYYECQKCHHK